jgi:hypothetical protein
MSWPDNDADRLNRRGVSLSLSLSGGFSFLAILAYALPAWLYVDQMMVIAFGIMTDLEDMAGSLLRRGLLRNAASRDVPETPPGPAGRLRFAWWRSRTATKVAGTD